MYKVKIYQSIFKKYYYWYLVRSLYVLSKQRKIQLEIIEKNSNTKTNHYEIIYVDDFPLVIDIADGAYLPPRKLLNYSDFRLLKSNLSIENRPYNWYSDLENKIKPYIIGRIFNCGYNLKEFKHFQSHIKSSKYKVVSFAGSGCKALETKNRLKIFDLFKEIFQDKCLLVFRDREHFSKEEKAKFPEWNNYFKKYGKSWQWHKKNHFGSYAYYLGMLSEGEFSINTPGIGKSQPFRCVDAILANRCIISTKIYVDIYKTFPCVKLPIDGYLNSELEDYEKAKKILRNIGQVNQQELKQKQLDWYSWYLSPEGMFKNQILKALEK